MAIKSFELPGAAEGLRDSIGSLRIAALQQEISERLSGIRQALGEEVVLAALETGRADSAAQAIVRALAALGETRA